MKLIVGLGNPGDKYIATRHNVGFLAVDHLQKVWNGSDWSYEKKRHAWTSKVRIDAESALLAKPDTFMNLSGRAIQALLTYYDLSLEDLVIIYDDLDLPAGTTRITGQSAGGHNGMKSIFQELGTQNIQRIRIGIDRPESPIPTADYVLGRLSPNEATLIEKSISNIPDLATALLSGNTEVP